MKITIRFTKLLARNRMPDSSTSACVSWYEDRQVIADPRFIISAFRRHQRELFIEAE